MEIELKYKLNEASDADAIFDDVRILDMADAGSEKHIKMHAVYFDTKDGNLDLTMRQRLKPYLATQGYLL